MQQPIRYQPRWRQLVPYALSGPIWLLALASLPGRSATQRVLLVLAMVVVTSGGVAAQRSTGVLLRPDALVLYGVRTRVVPWRDVERIAPGSLLGTRLVVVTARGRSYRLAAPTHNGWLAPDPDFEAKARTITAWWEHHRGADWAPPGDWWATSAGSAP